MRSRRYRAYCWCGGAAAVAFAFAVVAVAGGVRRDIRRVVTRGELAIVLSLAYGSSPL